MIIFVEEYPQYLDWELEIPLCQGKFFSNGLDLALCLKDPSQFEVCYWDTRRHVAQFPQLQKFGHAKTIMKSKSVKLITRVFD